MTEQVSYVGRRLGNYQLIRLLGQGGFAEVYLGEHVHLKTQAAVKLLHTRLTNDDREGFRHEAQMIAQLVHPHIVRVLDFGIEDNAPYLVMDFAPHGTLRNRHPKGTQVPLFVVVSYVKQVADALQYAHAQRLIHRDIKPENMLVGRNNEILLSDFGIALAAQSSSYQSTKDVAGTIAYMAPEQIQAHPRPASDQYSLGIVVYEWLCGNRPFQGSYTEVAIKHTMVPPAPLRIQLPQLPSAVEEVVMRALQKDPHARFADVRSFGFALEQASLSGSYNPTSYPVAANLSAPPPPPPFPGNFTQSPATSLMQPSIPPGPLSVMQMPQTPYAYNGGAITRYNSPVQPTPGTSLYPRPLSASKRGISRRALIGAIGVGGLLVTAGGGVAVWSWLKQNVGVPLSSSGNPLSRYLSSTPASPSPLVTYRGHSDYIWSAAWSRNGTYVASASSDGTVQVWEANTGKRLLSSRSHIEPAQSNDWARSVAWLPTSKQIVMGFQDGRAESLDIESRKLTGVFGGSNWSVDAVAWSPDGRYIAAGRFDNSIMVYEAASGKPLLTYTGHNDGVLAIAWSPDGNRVVSGSSDGTAQVWRPTDGHTLLLYKNHTSDVRSVSWSPDGTLIVSGSWDGTAQVWESDTGHTLLTYTKHVGGQVNAVSWSHHGSLIASGGNDVNTHIWEAQTGKLVHTYYTFPIFSLDWSPDGSRIVTAGYNKVGQIWSTQ